MRDEHSSRNNGPERFSDFLSRAHPDDILDSRTFLENARATYANAERYAALYQQLQETPDVLAQLDAPTRQMIAEAATHYKMVRITELVRLINKGENTTVNGTKIDIKDSKSSFQWEQETFHPTEIRIDEKGTIIASGFESMGISSVSNTNELVKLVNIRVALLDLEKTKEIDVDAFEKNLSALEDRVYDLTDSKYAHRRTSNLAQDQKDVLLQLKQELEDFKRVDPSALTPEDVKGAAIYSDARAGRLLRAGVIVVSSKQSFIGIVEGEGVNDLTKRSNDIAHYYFRENGVVMQSGETDIFSDATSQQPPSQRMEKMLDQHRQAMPLRAKIYGAIYTEADRADTCNQLSEKMEVVLQGKKGLTPEEYDHFVDVLGKAVRKELTVEAYEALDPRIKGAFEALAKDPKVMKSNYTAITDKFLKASDFPKEADMPHHTPSHVDTDIDGHAVPDASHDMGKALKILKTAGMMAPVIGGVLSASEASAKEREMTHDSSLTQEQRYAVYAFNASLIAQGTLDPTQVVGSAAIQTAKDALVKEYGEGIRKYLGQTDVEAIAEVKLAMSASFDSAQAVIDALPKDVETLRAMVTNEKLPPDIRHLAEGKMMMMEHYWDVSPSGMGAYLAGKDIIERTANKIYENQEKHQGGGMDAALAAAKQAGCTAKYECSDQSQQHPAAPPSVAKSNAPTQVAQR